MEIFDLEQMKVESYASRDQNVFFQNEHFKTRVIELKQGERIPDCQMDCYVLFYVVKGDVMIQWNGESKSLKENQLLITEPALLSMETVQGARLMGIQISI